MYRIGDIIKVNEEHVNCIGEITKGTDVIVMECVPGINYYTIKDIKTGVIIKGCILE